MSQNNNNCGVASEGGGGIGNATAGGWRSKTTHAQTAIVNASRSCPRAASITLPSGHVSPAVPATSDSNRVAAATTASALSVEKGGAITTAGKGGGAGRREGEEGEEGEEGR